MILCALDEEIFSLKLYVELHYYIIFQEIGEPTLICTFEKRLSKILFLNLIMLLNCRQLT